MEDKPVKTPKMTKKEKKAEEAKKPFVLKPKKPTSPWIYFNNDKVAELKEKEITRQQIFIRSQTLALKNIKNEQIQKHLKK